MQSVSTIKEYIHMFPEEKQMLLRRMFNCLLAALPDAKQVIKYGMPTFVGNKNLVHFSAMKHHIGFYPGPDAIQTFSKELQNYTTSKGAIHFPLDADLPTDLITKIALYRLQKDSI
jgi:uncharacterized protein YdhG (YjbR/CyaY superfamily)